MRKCIKHGEKEGVFCGECSRPLKLASFEKSAFTVSGNEPCPRCGYQLDGKLQDFCPGCRIPLKWD